MLFTQSVRAEIVEGQAHEIAFDGGQIQRSPHLEKGRWLLCGCLFNFDISHVSHGLLENIDPFLFASHILSEGSKNVFPEFVVEESNPASGRCQYRAKNTSPWEILQRWVRRCKYIFLKGGTG
jgi:hypothetical protein